MAEFLRCHRERGCHMRQPLLRRDRQEVGISAGADCENGLLKHSKAPFLKGLRFLNSLRSDNVAEPTTNLSRCKQFPFPQDSTCLITPTPDDLFCRSSPLYHSVSFCLGDRFSGENGRPARLQSGRIPGDSRYPCRALTRVFRDFIMNSIANDF